MKEIELTPSDECIKQQWELTQQLGISDETWEDFYKRNKQPRKALFG